MDIYIKPVKKVSLTEQKEVLIKHISDVIATADVADKVKEMSLIKLNGLEKGKKQNYLISVTDIIKAIKKSYPDYSVVNLGEMDTVVEYAPVHSYDSPGVKWAKITFVCLVLMTGSATAVMSFHTDAQIPTVFQNLYKIFFNVSVEKTPLISVPYSIGLAVGILVFFNHFAGKKITDDPTPLEVEMTIYETEVTDSVIDALDRERRGQDGTP